MIDAINESWKWMQIVATDVVATNSFGNVIFRDDKDKFWRICPEELSCSLIALDKQGFEELREKEAFKLGWEMEELTKAAKDKLGDPPPGSTYCLKFPPVLGGLYDAANLGVIAQQELIKFSGKMAFQIKDLPDGAKININMQDLFL
ncbi:MAG: T6SS immunity protein Tdi1 domain-containing protein [Bacteroidota bacterium]